MVGRSLADTAGSQAEVAGIVAGGAVPRVDAAAFRAAITAVAAANAAGLVRSCHDVSDGGLAAAVAEMAIAGGLGARLELGAVPCDSAAVPAAARDAAVAFAETPGRFVCAVAAEDAGAFATAMADVPWAWIGAVAAEPVLEIVGVAGGVERVPLERLAAAWHTPAGETA